MIPRLAWAVWLLLALCLGYLVTAGLLWVRAARAFRSRRRWTRTLLLVATALGLASLSLLGRGARNCANVASFEAIFARAGDDVGQPLPIDGSIASACRSGAAQNVSTALALWLVMALLMLTAAALVRRHGRVETAGRFVEVTP